MVEKLEGRLMWEKAGERMRVAIPMRRGPMAGIYVPLILIWLGVATTRYWHLFAAPHPDDREFTLQLMAIAIYVLGFCFFVCWLAWTTTGETILFLDPNEMKIQRRVIGVELSTRSFPTSNVSQLRYVAPAGIATYQGVTNPSTSRIRFQADNATHSLARGLSEAEAHALIEKMLEIYRFPKSGLLDFGAVAR